MCTPSFMQASFQRAGLRPSMTGEGVRSASSKPMRPSRAPIEDLRLAIDGLPLRTREAMLAGIRSQEVMLASRTSFPAFARAWDRFAGGRRARRTNGRELRVLERHLRASILAER